jgi:hypothetical protein
MKICYMNDETKAVRIQIVGMPNKDPRVWDHVKEDVLYPQQTKVFEFEAPEGAIPYVKRWDSRIVLLSYIAAESIDHI